MQECLNKKCGKVTFIDTCTYAIRKSFITDYGSTSYFCPVVMHTKLSQEEAGFLNFCTGKGLAEIQEEWVNQGCSSWKVNRVKLTDEGQKYLQNESDGQYVIWTATFDIGEVTGILEEKEGNLSTVEYMIKKTKRSPFGEFWEMNCQQTDKPYTATFTKYDDGWRL